MNHCPNHLIETARQMTLASLFSLLEDIAIAKGAASVLERPFWLHLTGFLLTAKCVWWLGFDVWEKVWSILFSLINRLPDGHNTYTNKYSLYRILWLSPCDTYIGYCDYFPNSQSQFQYCSLIVLWLVVVSVFIGYCDIVTILPSSRGRHNVR